MNNTRNILSISETLNNVNSNDIDNNHNNDKDKWRWNHNYDNKDNKKAWPIFLREIFFLSKTRDESADNYKA